MYSKLFLFLVAIFHFSFPCNSYWYKNLKTKISSMCYLIDNCTNFARKKVLLIKRGTYLINFWVFQLGKKQKMYFDLSIKYLPLMVSKLVIYVSCSSKMNLINQLCNDRFMGQYFFFDGIDQGEKCLNIWTCLLLHCGGNFW